MASLHSVLIQTCMANIHKEINQLEHWLITLPNQGVPSGESALTPIHSLATAMERLSKQFDVQQHALNHIVDRLDILERDRDPADSQESAPNDYLDPWIDSSRTPLQNEIIDVLEPAYTVPDPVYTVHKTETLFEPPFVAPASLKASTEEVIAAVEIVPVIQAVTAVEPVTAVESVTAVEPVPVAALVAAPSAEVAPKAEEPEEEEAEEEAEEEGMELDTIEFNGISYYRDDEGFIYGIMEDDQPSDTAIGLWKEKTKTIKFYRTQ